MQVNRCQFFIHYYILTMFLGFSEEFQVEKVTTLIDKFYLLSLINFYWWVLRFSTADSFFYFATLALQIESLRITMSILTHQ